MRKAVTDFSIRPYAPQDAESCARVFERAWHAGHPYAPREIDVAAFEADTRGELIVVAETAEAGE